MRRFTMDAGRTSDADGDGFREVVLNLVVNALEAVEDGGGLVRVECAAEAGPGVTWRARASG